MRPWSLRLRVGLFFIALGVAVPVVVMGVLFAAWTLWGDSLAQGDAGPLLLAGAAASFVLVALVAGVWLLFDVNVAESLQRLANDAETALYANPDHWIDPRPGRHLGRLPEVLRAAVKALAEARRDTAQKIAEATGAVEQTRARLATLLNELEEGVVMCTLDHRILLYNRAALRLMQRGDGELGLGRSLFGFLNRQPFFHGLERLSNRLHDGRHRDHPDGLALILVCATVDGRTLLRGRMNLVTDDAEAPTAYLLTLHDATEDLEALGRRDHLLDRATNGLRRPLAALAVAAWILDNRDPPPEVRRRFARILAERVDELCRMVEDNAAAYSALLEGHWPLADIWSANLLDGVVRRLRDRDAVDAVMVGLPCWLHGDNTLLVELLDHLIGRLRDRGVDLSAQDDGEPRVTLEARPENSRVTLEVVWPGEPVPYTALESWLEVPLEGAPGGITGRDVLMHHKTDLWSQAAAGGRACLRMPLPQGVKKRTPRPALPPRPEFFDFNLPDTGARLGDCPLRVLSYISFDTETTGLQPSAGDRIVSLAGVRIVNGRVLTGESFSRLVDPGIPIPRRASRIHGITDDMVSGKPALADILPRFHAFARDAVLIAHNAAFDMKFLALEEKSSGLVFGNPVLDTLLLSVWLHDHESEHGLDAVAARFGVPLAGRHTAMGDALVTAAVFLRMIDLLEARGVTTLDQAIAAGNRMVAVRRQQEKF